MAQEPKRRHSKARKRTRRASINLEQVALVVCTNCQSPVVPHQVCTQCGFYKSKQVSTKTEVKVTKV